MITYRIRRPLARPAACLILLATAAAVGCSRKSAVQQSSAGAVDTAALRTGAAVPSAGPGVQVTKTDSKSVRDAEEYKLTDENLTKFMRAADSLSTLEARDPTARGYLGNDMSDAGAKEADAGVKWLEANPTINNAIASSGLSVRDYFVMSIAIASAERFIANPKAAPPTPTLQQNAEFLRGKTAELDHLRDLLAGMPDVRVTP